MGMWGPLLDLMANRMICLLPKMKSKQMVSKPQKTMMISVTPDSSAIVTNSLLYLDANKNNLLTPRNYYVVPQIVYIF
jgi:hypothetical protein